MSFESRHPYRLDQLLRAAAERVPQGRAVESDGAAVTYAELDRAADNVAAALVGQGVGIGDRVGVHVPKSIETVASIYGIMRAGAAYVPIDIASPPTRAAYIATNCAISALVSDPGRIAALREVDLAAAPRGICLGDPAPPDFVSWESVQASADRAPARALVDTDLAYILYTSGSTGTPKGVAISHRNSLTFVRWAHQTFGLQSDDVLSNHAPFHFDLSTLDLFGAAAAGATVSLVPATAAMFPVRLTEWIRSRAITVWYSVPSALSMLVRYGELTTHPLESVRLILFAGETFPVRYLRELMTLVPEARFFNLFGPTETNVCTFYEVQAPPGEDDPPVPIGRACENTRCEVVDQTGAVATRVGEEGELVVRGSTVAQGYWDDPERTALRFPDSYTYRTGDIVELLADSPPTYRFVGRNDHLVKSRGYRIELGEVESALYGSGEVEEGVVVPVPDDLMGNRLVAFCSVRGDIGEEELKQRCRERVPSYMVPDRIEIVEALPRTANDKYDRSRLAELAAGRSGDRA
ncbi:MAG TPA: amino acid adenylation domain-containing protein [Solirubrobacteraceae bacterium]|nr:amino acid adenylation domain-containing protein [Solirubrobacteraceae bacterium]